MLKSHYPGEELTHEIYNKTIELSILKILYKEVFKATRKGDKNRRKIACDIIEIARELEILNVIRESRKAREEIISKKPKFN